MTKVTEEAKQSKVEAAKKTAPTVLTLIEFCSRLSESDKRVNIIGAFEFTERASGKSHDTEDAYRARYAAFINRPA